MDAVQEALARGERPIKLTKTSSKTGHSICFDCEHAIKDCAWSREWKAIPCPAMPKSRIGLSEPAFCL